MKTEVFVCFCFNESQLLALRIAQLKKGLGNWKTDMLKFVSESRKSFMDRMRLHSDLGMPGNPGRILSISRKECTL